MFKAIFFNLTDLELRRKLRVQEVSESVADPEHLARSFCDIGTGILLPVHLKFTSVLNYFSRDSFPLNITLANMCHSTLHYPMLSPVLAVSVSCYILGISEIDRENRDITISMYLRWVLSNTLYLRWVVLNTLYLRWVVLNTLYLKLVVQYYTL